METLKFQVDKQVEAVEFAMREVKNLAIMDTILAAQTPERQGGHMPIVTGFLWSSGEARVGASIVPTRFNPSRSGVYSWDAAETKLTIDSSKLSDSITFAWAANYAPYVNYGANGRPGHMFADLAAQRWPQFVDNRAAQAKTKYRL